MQNPLTKFPIQAGMLSFMLPGLGQVYQRRFVWAFPFFIAHVTALSFANYRVWIFVPMVISAWDAQRQPNQKAVEWNTRTFTYLVAGGIAFFSAFSLMIDRVLPFPAIGKMTAVADLLSDQIISCALVRGTMPSALAQCPEVEAKWRKDPWGTPFRYVIVATGFEIRSAGRDGLDQTDDDFIFHFRTPRFEK